MKAIVGIADIGAVKLLVTGRLDISSFWLVCDSCSFVESRKFQLGCDDDVTAQWRVCPAPNCCDI